MFLLKEALHVFLLLNAYICLIARGQNSIPTPKVRVCNDYADIAFLVDVSRAINFDGTPGYLISQIRLFLKSFVGMLNVGPGKIQVGMVTFGNNGYLQFPLKSDVSEVLRGIDNIVYPNKSESRNTADGILVMRTQVLGYTSPNYRPDAARLCIIVTLGQSNVNRDYTYPYAFYAKDQGIIILSLGCTPDIKILELVKMASILPGLNIAIIERAVANQTFVTSGAVVYFPTIWDLSSFVQQVSYYVGQTDCKKVATTVNCKNTADWCTSAYITPYNCYDAATEKICCRFCRENLLMLGLPTSCRYGDYYPWCEAKFCAKYYTKCCKTCPTFECNDKAEWCSGTASYNCYDLQTELNTCCKTCRTRLTGNPMCRYGNAFPWCAPEHCKSTDITTTLGCCTTCPNATCIDNSPSCNSMFPGNCYDGQTERMCCRSCRNKLRADLSCRYDDQYDWCTSKFCWDTPRNCCSTCPKYIP